MEPVIYERGMLPDGEHRVIVVFKGHPPTKSWGGCIPKPAIGLLKLEGRKQPRLTLLSFDGALGVLSLTTWILKGDDIKVESGTSTISPGKINGFKEKLLNLKKPEEFKINVWWGLR